MTGPDAPLSVARTVTGRVLVVDDEEKNRRLLRDILEAQGHQVLLANDGEQALAIAWDERPDVVLLDLMMPKLDGYQTCARLREDARTRHVPILAVTALRDRADRLTAIRAGANDFLTKPIDAEEIRLRVSNAMYAKQLYDQVQLSRANLQAIEVLRNNLTDLIVHDIRSPLAAAAASFHVMSMARFHLSDEQQQLVALGQHACREMSDIVGSLLDVSRMEAGEMPLSRSPCDILEIARAAVDSVALLTTQQALTIRVSGEPVSLSVDREIMHRVIVNLLGNAIRYSPQGGAIDVAITRQPEAVRVSVTDRGCGVPLESQERIFEKFGRVESRRHSRRHSVGLGLTFCKLAVEAHGGHIGIESEVGHGSNFWFSLPAVWAEDPMPDSQPT
jgi:two-component system sensor histidine kinase/response regulator